MKKITSVLAVLLITALLVSSCSSAEGSDIPLTVNSTPISGEIFRYYLDEAFGELSLTDRSSRINYATERCIRYVAVNTSFANMGLSLKPSEQVRVSEEANAFWRLFGAHYADIGVSKETFVKIDTSKAYTEKIREALYGTDGSQPISEDEMKAYFDANYAAIKYVDGYLYTTDASGVKKGYDENTVNSIFERFDSVARQINSGAAPEVIFATLPESVGIDIRQHLSSEVISEGEAGFPNGFYSAVREIGKSNAGVLLFSEHIYVVIREDILADPSLFDSHRSECLKAVSEVPLQNEINTMCEAFTSVRKTRVAQECYNTVLDGRREKK